MHLPEESGTSALHRLFTWRLVVWVPVVLVGLIALWWFLERILATTRGLDLSDEGLYLLAADPPSSTAAWGFPFGWHTHPFFVFVGYDIASFRTLGAIILVLVSAWLGFAAARAAARVTANDGRAVRWWVLISAAAAAAGAMLFYAPMLRTPSYNWINLVGLLMSSAAAFVVIRRCFDAVLIGRRLVVAVLAGVSSFALFATFPAKPTTLPLMVLLTTMLVLVAVGVRIAGWWALWNLLLLPVWLALGLVTTTWPSSFLSVFRLALQMPAPDPLQTTGSAIRAALLLPRDLVAGLAMTPDLPALVLLAGVTIAVIAAATGRRWLAIRLTGFGLTVVASLTLAGVPLPLVNPIGQPFGIAHAPLTTACLVILAAALLASARLGSRARAAQRLAHRSTIVCWASVAFLCVMPFVFSFGSGNGIYAQASLASGTILLAGVIAIARGVISRDRLIVAAAVLLATLLVGTASVVSGWRAPFRAAPLTEQTSPTVVGAHGAHLLLDPALSQGISSLRQQAETAGWTPGTPLVDVSYMWNPAIPYALGARVPDFLALTIFGYSAAHDITDFHLSEPYRNFPFDQTWILTTRRALLDEPMNNAVDFTLKKLVAVSGRPFPDSYACVAAGDFVLWRPTSSAQETGQDCEG